MGVTMRVECPHGITYKVMLCTNARCGGEESVPTPELRPLTWRQRRQLRKALQRLEGEAQ